jgi:hypothetical protein
MANHAAYFKPLSTGCCGPRGLYLHHAIARPAKKTMIAHSASMRRGI